MFKLGDRVLLKRYEPYSDYKKHIGQEGIIIERYRSNGFAWRIEWSDGDTSLVEEQNIKPSGEWDSENN